MKRILLCFITFSLFSPFLKGQIFLINLGTTTVETSPLLSTNEPPWELKYGPGDSLWMTTKNGKVYRIHPTTGAATQLLDYSGVVYQAGEAGMLGMTFHPDFANSPFVYIAYSYTNGGNFERLSRFTYTGNALTGELVLIDNIAANTNHDGSRLLILPDNTILMSTGDALNTANPQNTASLNGKMLRVNLDGTIPADNPFPGSPVYSFGHRNPQGLLLHPNGKIYSTEHGPNNNDEFQIIEKGRNYGWPNVVGFCDDDVPGETAFCTANNVKEPLASWNPAPGITWAPNDLIWYTHPSIPEFQNSFLVTFLKTEKVRRIQINAAGDAITAQDDFFVSQWGRLRDITAGPDGSIYLATNVNPYRIIKIRATGVTPVLISNFKVNCNDQASLISWTTESEINNKHFLLYKSSDGINYDLVSTIASLAPAGNSAIKISYSYADNGNRSTNNLYKLVSEDRDGRKKDWGIITSNCGVDVNRFTLLPNPVKGQSKLMISGAADLLTINVHNSVGQPVYQKRSSGTVVLPSDKWQPGVYSITVMNNKQEVVYRNKLLVQ
jgi:glucose/arabinose dehydrogenase